MTDKEEYKGAGGYVQAGGLGLSVGGGSDGIVVSGFVQGSIVELPQKLRPCHIGDMPGQLAVFKHILDFQCLDTDRLDTDRLVFVDQSS